MSLKSTFFKINANSILSVQSLGNQTTGTVSIYSVLGELIEQFELIQTATIDISAYQKGMYLVVITAENSQEVLRLVKD